jgi:acyl carrier protein
MERNELLTQLQELFRDVLDEENIVLTELTTANDVDGWGSLTHIQLVVAIEKQLKIRFTSKEILSWKNIGEMMDSILSK